MNIPQNQSWGAAHHQQKNKWAPIAMATRLARPLKSGESMSSSFADSILQTKNARDFSGKVHSFVGGRKDEDEAGTQLLYRRSFDEYCQSIRSADESKRGGSKKRHRGAYCRQCRGVSSSTRIQDDNERRDMRGTSVAGWLLMMMSEDCYHQTVRPSSLPVTGWRP